MTLQKTIQLQGIIEKYCSDYRRFLSINDNNEIQARFQSYENLIGQRSLNEIYSIVNEMSNEVIVLSITNRDNMRVQLFKMFEIINHEIKHRPKLSVTSIQDFQHAYLFQVYDMIDHVTKTVKKLIRELSPIKKAKPKASTSLFRNEDDTQKYLDVLKSTKKPITDKDGYFKLGVNSKSKGSITAWLDILTDEKKINYNLSWPEKAVHINNLIPNLEISDRSLQNSSQSRTEYHNELFILISKI